MAQPSFLFGSVIVPLAGKEKASLNALSGYRGRRLFSASKYVASSENALCFRLQRDGEYVGLCKLVADRVWHFPAQI